MKFDLNEFVSGFDSWEQIMKKFNLPKFSELPKLDLYMDQVTVLINQYFEFLSIIKSGEKIITPAMINNYVKMKIIPAPVRKRYSRKHLAYLIMVCSLKQSLNISVIQKMIPIDLDDEKVEEAYTLFTQNREKSFVYATEQIKHYSQPILNAENEKINDLIIQVAVSANIFKIFTEMVIELKLNNQPEKEKNEKNKKQTVKEKDKPKEEKEIIEE